MMGVRQQAPDSDADSDTRGDVDAQEARDQLRRDFPHVGLLHDPWSGRWKAVWGMHGYADAASPEELRQQLPQQTHER